MIPYKVKFLLSEKAEDFVDFESNEKPVKGELFTIQDENGKHSSVKITEVLKFVIRGKKSAGEIEYRCKTETHEESAMTIGFGKRP
jgi:hypothetical protein